ncbi:hypothetical protein [Clostridium intestinale]|uniref:Transposase n=1 Tax=Clostridium intestinale TaxID=36845 RepID=A0A7D6VPN7_9CLOT|nr:hypothetical protein [Clostridium intestinale]QLY79206.1 hypothetical protein HZF06_19335 [Clostridium intestinale]
MAGRKKTVLNKDRVIELYNKYGSMTRTSLSLGCSNATLKKFLIENGIEIKTPPKPPGLSIK